MLDVNMLISKNKYLSKFKWHTLIVNHSIQPRKGRSFNYPDEYSRIGYTNGIYIFINQGGEFLYVGEAGTNGGNLKDRLKSRFRELHGSIDPNYLYHSTFLQENQDENMVILTTEIGDRMQRLIAEEYLTVFLQPKFIEYKFKTRYKL